MWPLRQSTAGQEIPLGPFVDSTDGNTQETALVIANTDVKLYKNGAVVEVAKNAGDATHMNNGRYYAVLDATDTDTLGPMRVLVHVSGALAVWLDCWVMTADAYDSLVSGGAPAQAGGRPASLFGMMRRTFEWVANKRTRDRSTGVVNLKAEGGGTTLETQTQSTSGTVDSQTEGS